LVHVNLHNDISKILTSSISSVAILDATNQTIS
jgi:hypothetical protein